MMTWKAKIEERLGCESEHLGPPGGSTSRAGVVEHVDIKDARNLTHLPACRTSCLALWSTEEKITNPHTIRSTIEKLN